jgi:hypothetical protein
MLAVVTEVVGPLLSQLREQREALKKLEGWDMLTIVPPTDPVSEFDPYHGYKGAATSDATWARTLIAKALGKPDPTAALPPVADERTEGPMGEENTRLREALERIEASDYCLLNPPVGKDCRTAEPDERLWCPICIARAALAALTPDTEGTGT